MSIFKDRLKHYRTEQLDLRHLHQIKSEHRSSVKVSPPSNAQNAPEEETIEMIKSPDEIPVRTVEWFLAKVDNVIDVTNAIDLNIRALKEIFLTVTGSGHSAGTSAVAHLAYSLCVIPFHQTFGSLPFPKMVHEVKKLCEIVKGKMEDIAPDVPSLYTWSSTSTENKICNFHYIRMVNKLAEVMALCADAQNQYEKWQKTAFPDMDKEVGCPLIEPHQQVELSNSRDIDMTDFYKRDSDKAEDDLREIRNLMVDIAYYTETIEKQAKSVSILEKQISCAAETTKIAIPLVDKAIMRESRKRRGQLRRDVKLGIAAGVIVLKIVLVVLYFKFGDDLF